MFFNTIRNSDVISVVKRYIRILTRSTKEEADVRKEEFSMKTSNAYFKTCSFWALGIVPTLDVPVLFIYSDSFSWKQLFSKSKIYLPVDQGVRARVPVARLRELEFSAEQNMKNSGGLLEKTCGITLHLSLFRLESKKTSSSPSRSLCFRTSYLNSTYVITVIQIARWIWRYFEIYNVTEVDLQLLLNGFFKMALKNKPSWLQIAFKVIVRLIRSLIEISWIGQILMRGSCIDNSFNSCKLALQPTKTCKKFKQSQQGSYCCF